ncbi:hypothetical protein Tco_0484398 [Tanacetum coccineum]
MKGVVIQELGESTTTKSLQLSSQQSQDKAEFDEEEILAREKAEKEQEANIALIETWDDIQAKINDDHHLAKRLQAQEQEELSIKENDMIFRLRLRLIMNWLKDCKQRSKKSCLLKKRQNYFNNSLEQRRNPLLLLKNMEKKKLKDMKNKSFDSIYKMFDRASKRVNTFVDFRTDLVEGSSKRAGEELEQENKDEVVIDVVPLATKPPTIIDWKIHKEGKNGYFQIISADGSSKMYLVFSQLLKSVDREDLVELYKLVKDKYGSTIPVEDMDLLLWGDLKTMFESHVEDEIWKLQQRYKVLSWKLFDSCRVHCLSLQSGMIYMLVEKRSPLTPPTITDMLNKKSQVDYFSKMAYQLLKLLTKQFKNQ